MVRSTGQSGRGVIEMRLWVQGSIILMFCLFLAASPVMAVEQVQIFPLQHRSASSVINQVEGLLRDGERVSAAENNLVMIASPATLEAAERLIALLDHPLRQFRVQVRWVDSVAASHGRLGYDAKSGLTTLPGQGTTLGTSQRQSGQQLLVSEGESAFIVTGRDIPYSAQWAVWSGSDGQGFAQATAFQEIRSGFSILINMTQEDELQARVTPQLMAAGKGTMLNPAILSLDRLTTRIRLKPGEWVDLAAFLPEAAVGSQLLTGTDESLPSGRLLQFRIDAQK